MKKTSETIIFFGSGPVAAASLKLLAKHAAVEAVVTKPSTLAEMTAVSPTDRIYTVSNRAELTELVISEKFKSPLGVVIDFGIIIGQDVIDAFELGIINSHFSLLPEWRGADPITFSILSGQTKTGVSLMVIDAGLDTGKIIAQKSLPINADETGITLTDRLIHLSDAMLQEHLSVYAAGERVPRSQPHPDRATYSRKLAKDDGILDWDKTAEQLEREVRAFIGWPKSRTMLAGKEVIVTAAHAATGDQEPGKTTIDGKTIKVGCKKGLLVIDRLKPAGKNEMTAEAFLAGHKQLF